jgi:DHA2 family multidrug resistance protein
VKPAPANLWLIAFTVTLATFMEVLDTSIANVALPHIAGNLSVGVDESTWVLTSYLVANAIILPLSGWLSVVFGRKRFYMTCVVIFTASSFLCGLAPNLGALIVCRILQGLGGGGLQPSEQAILADTFPQEKRGLAFAFYGFAVVAAPAIGPTLGGYITDYWSWRWVFYINIPVGVLSLLLTSQLIHDPPSLVEERARRQKEPGRVDWPGLGLIAVGLGALQIMLDKGEREDWFASDLIRVSALVAAVALVLAVVWELWHEDPIVDLRLLGERNFGTACLLMLILGFVLLGSTVMLPQFTQALLGYTATDAGLVLSPGGLVIMASMPLVGVLLSRGFDARRMIIFGLLIGASGLYWMSHFTTGIDFRTLVLARCVQAAGLGFLFVPINTISYAFIPPGKTNNASGLINLARNMGGSVGIAFMTTLLARRSQYHQNVIAAHATPYDPLFRDSVASTTRVLQHHAPGAARVYGLIYQTLIEQATMLAYADCFFIMSVCFVGTIAVTFIMRRPKKAVIAVH